MTSSTTKGKINKLVEIFDGYEIEINATEDTSETTMKQIKLVTKINQIIDRLNELERTKHG